MGRYSSLNLRLGLAIGMFLLPWIFFATIDLDVFPFSNFPMYSESKKFEDNLVFYSFYHVYPDGREVRLSLRRFLWPRPEPRLALVLNKMTEPEEINRTIDMLMAYYKKDHVRLLRQRPRAERPVGLLLKREIFRIHKRSPHYELDLQAEPEVLRKVELQYE